MPKADYLIRWVETSLTAGPSGLIFAPADPTALETKLINATSRADFVDAATDLLGYCDFITKQARGAQAAASILELLARVFSKAGRSELGERFRVASESIQGKQSQGAQLGAPLSAGVRLRK